MKNPYKLLVWIGVALLFLTIVGAFYRFTKQPAFNVSGDRSVRIYVYPGASWSDVLDSIARTTDAPLLCDLRLHLKFRTNSSPSVGSYTIEPKMTVQALYNRLVYGMQTPISLYFTSYRLPSQLYRRLGSQLMIDSVEVAKAMNDSLLLHSLNVPDTTLVYYVLPNTYEVYWDITPNDLIQKLAGESRKFWDAHRKAQADSLGLSPYEVITLASIVQEESAKVDEYPMIARLYLNRLKIGMPLQADPTIKFALKDFGLRRIRHNHLKVDSPYNTYTNKGLPKGPIRIPTMEAIDGVLNASDHSYLYMCAKEDFSGYHNFASTYSEHQKNAGKYVAALNDRGIN
ncbi:endolytic transglycosylase MltG [uncultured Porphyromonas sp.]|uniref:endolytic transglycosylase MltG n=1 Tax=uncultured Porphyromonas sp. TaxID=159274 RepID=UPI0026266E35|nr:endolytic transglycosylase MltG [uncultured Porphyromonas sp.]